MSDVKCTSCGCECTEEVAVMEDATQTVESHQEETQLAVLLALVPAMTMTLFNMMGLL